MSVNFIVIHFIKTTCATILVYNLVKMVTVVLNYVQFLVHYVLDKVISQCGHNQCVPCHLDPEYFQSKTPYANRFLRATYVLNIYIEILLKCMVVPS